MVGQHHQLNGHEFEQIQEKEMAAHSGILAWRIPGTEEPVGCHLWGRTESDTTDVTQQQQEMVEDRRAWRAASSWGHKESDTTY